MDLAGARPHSRKCVGDAVFRVVMGVDANDLGRDFARNRSNDFLDLMRQGPAIRVTENHPARSGLISGPCASKSVGRVRLVAVEEMLAIEIGSLSCTRIASTDWRIASRFSSFVTPSATST